MTEQRACANETGLLQEIQYHAVKLAALIEALDPLHEAALANDGPHSERARNSMPEAIEAAIERAWALVTKIEAAEKAKGGAK